MCMLISFRRAACPSDRYGTQCLQQCQCENGGTCNPQTGECSCTPGWIGRLCEQRKRRRLYVFDNFKNKLFAIRPFGDLHILKFCVIVSKSVSLSHTTDVGYVNHVTLIT